MIREEGSGKSVRRCANCLIPLRGPGVTVNGETYCCQGCANGGPCICTYADGDSAPPALATENPRRHISLVILYDSDISIVFKCRALLLGLADISGLSPLRFEGGKAALEFEAPNLAEVAMQLLAGMPPSAELSVTTEGDRGVISLNLGNGKKVAAAKEVKVAEAIPHIVAEEKKPSPPPPSPKAEIAERIVQPQAPQKEVPPPPRPVPTGEMSRGEAVEMRMPPGLRRARIAQPGWQLVVDAFFNARHFITSNGQPGEVHPHSWRVRAVVEVEAMDGRGLSVPTRAVRDAIERQAGKFDGVLMNDTPPFNQMPPTIENVASVLFGAINADLGELPVRLRSIWVWDSPTSYVIYSEDEVRNG